MNSKISTDNDNDLQQNQDKILQSKPSKQYDFFPISFWQKELESQNSSDLDSKSDRNQFNKIQKLLKQQKQFFLTMKLQNINVININQSNHLQKKMIKNLIKLKKEKFFHYIWHYIGNLQIYNQTWITFYHLENASHLVRYNYSYYWAVVTMVTVGYGDITPQNNLEVFCVTIMILFSSVIFAYSINSIGILVKNISDEKFKFKKNITLINSFMREQNVDLNLQRRVINHLKQKSQQDYQEDKEQIDQCINTLPNNLKDDLYQNIKYNIIKKINLLTNQFDEQLLRQTSSILELECFYLKINYILKKFMQLRFRYFINSGRVVLFEEKSKKILKVLKKGDTFGEHQFFSGQESKESCIASEYSEIYKIERNGFLQIIKQNKKEYEKFCNIKDQILFNQSYSLLNIKCSFCKLYHTTIDCTLLSYQPNKYLLILKELKKKNEIRRFYRREQKKYNSLINVNQIKDICFQIQEIITQQQNQENYTEKQDQYNSLQSEQVDKGSQPIKSLNSISQLINNNNFSYQDNELHSK